MKKYLFRTILVSTSLLTLGTAVTSCVPVLADETNSSGIAICSDDEYYVLDEPSIQTKTWLQPQSWCVSKGNRTYLGTETHNRKTTLSIGATIFGMNIKIGNEYSVSGKFKKYRQNARITVTYRVYRKVDNKYIRTQTATANTQYIDYVAI